MSTNYLLLTSEELRKWMEEQGKNYRDPDKHSETLYQDLLKKWGFHDYAKIEGSYKLIDSKGKRYSSDFMGMSVQKLLLAYQKGYITVEEIITYLENTRILGGHMVWPVHALPTINTYRSQCYNDRVDFLLEDIKNFYLEKELVISERFCQFLKESNPEKEFLDSFGTGMDGFKKFIHTWKLEPFLYGYYVKDCNSEEYYQILCLTHSNLEESKILLIQKLDGHKYVENKNDINEKYFANYFHNTKIAIQEREKLF